LGTNAGPPKLLGKPSGPTSRNRRRPLDLVVRASGEADRPYGAGQCVRRERVKFHTVNAVDLFAADPDQHMASRRGQRCAQQGAPAGTWVVLVVVADETQVTIA
jgi:hypothetical protein